MIADLLYTFALWFVIGFIGSLPIWRIRFGCWAFARMDRVEARIKEVFRA